MRLREVTAVEQLAAERLATARLASPVGDRSDLIVDLLFASSGAESEIAARAEDLELLKGLVVPLARTGDLLALKLLARDDGPVRRTPPICLRCTVADADDLALARRTVKLIAERGFSRGRDLEAALDDLLAGS